MKIKHWILVGFVVVGGLYVLHIVTHHGGVSGFTGGLGLPGMRG
jgi:hypothetical protein